MKQKLLPKIHSSGNISVKGSIGRETTIAENEELLQQEEVMIYSINHLQKYN